MSPRMPHRPAVTMRTHEVFAMAHDLADRFGHADVTPSHVLLAMLREGRSPAIVVLYVLAVPLEELEHELESELSVPPRTQVPAGEHSWSESDEEMLERAGIESHTIRHEYVGCEHLLLAFLSDESGVAAKLLARHGANLVNARAAVLRVMGAPPKEGGSHERLRQP